MRCQQCHAVHRGATSRGGYSGSQALHRGATSRGGYSGSQAVLLRPSGNRWRSEVAHAEGALGCEALGRIERQQHVQELQRTRPSRTVNDNVVLYGVCAVCCMCCMVYGVCAVLYGVCAVWCMCCMLCMCCVLYVVYVICVCKCMHALHACADECGQACGWCGWCCFVVAGTAAMGVGCVACSL